MSEEKYREVNKMSFSEYRDLTPIDNIENGDEYIEALNWAFQNKKIKNIALTGPYGSGKSSIIETFLSEDEQKKSDRKDTIRNTSLKISMATFLAGNDGEKIDIDFDEVERGILKQLFYKVEPRRIPQSRYRKLHTVTPLSAFIHSLLGIVLICFMSIIFMPTVFEKYVGDIKNLLPSGVNTPIYLVVAGVLIAVFLSIACAYLYFTVFSKFKIKGIKLPSDTTVQAGYEEAESVFNKNLDEIMYFFEATKYRTIFFEDLDRLSDSKIFVHLRELNNLLNNDDAIKTKPIVFVYAVRDDIFSKADRTKFFDFIVPVIPVINSTNAGEVLIQRLQEAKDNGINHEISQEFILDVAPYISDMRVLQNIYNEFIVYKKTLRTSQGLALSDEQMLAIMIFKNLYPSDFADIQEEKGIIKKGFEDKNHFITKKKNDIQREIDSESDIITKTQNDTMNSILELKYAMIVTLMDGFHRFDGFEKSWSSSISASKVMSDDFDMTELIKNDYTHIKFYHYSRGSEQKKIDANILKKYVERWTAIKQLEDNGLQKLQNDLNDFRDRQHALSGMTFSRIFELYSTEEVLSDAVRSNKLLTFMLRRGYIDEKYANYINYFKGNSITKDDMNFILSVKNQAPLSFDYQLTKTSMVVKRLQEYEFEQKEIYNFDLLEELLREESSDKLTSFIRQLADEDENSWNFIDEFVDITEYQERFFKLLACEWYGMWKFITSNEILTYDRKLFYLCRILDFSETAIVEIQNKDTCMTSFFEEHEDILQRLTHCDKSKVMSAIECLNVKFGNLLIDGVPDEYLDFVFDGCFYKLNSKMITTIVSYKNNNLVKQLTEQPYSTIVALEYPTMMTYIQENITDYIKRNILDCAAPADNAEDITDLIILLKGNEELQKQLIAKENFKLDSIEDCAGEQVLDDSDAWSNVWNTLLAEGKIDISWENIMAYWRVYGLSTVLRKYISMNVIELTTKDVSIVNDEFIGTFIESDFSIDVEEKILPILRMDSFNLDISSIKESTLKIMIDCNYFEFTAGKYSIIAEDSLELGVDYILNNQTAYMEQRAEIPMSCDLMDKLLLDKRFHQENKEILFSEHAECFMTEKLALNMHALNLPVTTNIFNAAWNCVKQEKYTDLLLDNCTSLELSDLQQRFADIGGEFKGLADRTKRHETTLPANSKNRLLAEHLKNIGYITSVEEIGDKSFSSPLDIGLTHKTLKLRVKQVK